MDSSEKRLDSKYLDEAWVSLPLGAENVAGSCENCGVPSDSGVVSSDMIKWFWR